MSDLNVPDDQSFGSGQIDSPSIADPTVVTLEKEKTRRPRGRSFQPGQSGNPSGRPKGSLNKATLLGQQLVAGQVETVFEQLFSAIEEGDTVTARFCAARLVPPQRSRHIQYELPEINTRADLDKAANAVWSACGKGDISLEDAECLMSLLKTRAQLFDGELACRVATLEKLLNEVQGSDAAFDTEKRLSEVQGLDARFDHVIFNPLVGAVRTTRKNE